MLSQKAYNSSSDSSWFSNWCIKSGTFCRETATTACSRSDRASSRMITGAAIFSHFPLLWATKLQREDKFRAKTIEGVSWAALRLRNRPLTVGDITVKPDDFDLFLGPKSRRDASVNGISPSASCCPHKYMFDTPCPVLAAWDIKGPTENSVKSIVGLKVAETDVVTGDIEYCEPTVRKERRGTSRNVAPGTIRSVVDVTAIGEPGWPIRMRAFSLVVYSVALVSNGSSQWSWYDIELSSSALNTSGIVPKNARNISCLTPKDIRYFAWEG